MPNWKKEETPQNPRLAWAKGKKPSMKRRCEQHNYYERGIYMITMATENRQPLLGTLAGNPETKEGEDAPHVVLSPLGERVKKCWLSIPQFHPVVEPLRLCIMPDHIHGILFVHERMEKHLGKVIEGFKTGTRKAARELGLLPASATVEYAAQPAQPPATPAQPTTTPTQPTTPPPPSRHTAAGRAHGLLWEPGYNDRILTRKGQLERMLAYLDDNPRRLLVKRTHPEYFHRLGELTLAGYRMQAMGNRFLLDNPVKQQVQCSRSLTQQEIEHLKTYIIKGAKENGAIIVSPCISPGEQQIATAAMQEKLPLIVLLLNGFPAIFKPQPRYLEACANGLLLMLSPFQYQNEKITNMRERCLQLNSIASKICE